MVDQLKREIEALPGVTSAYAKRTGSKLSANVFMEELETGSFSRVSEKELALFDQFPELEIRFMILPKEALEDMSVDSLHAA